MTEGVSKPLGWRIPSARRWALAVLAALLSATVGWAQSPLVAELREVEKRYHEDPSRLDRIRDGLEAALRTDAHVQNHVALGQVCFIWGDIRARTTDEKLAAYDRGREAAKRAMEVEPRNLWAHFWFATNTARWGQTKGIVRSLFLLPTVQGEIQLMLDLDPRFAPAYSLAGHVAYEVPALLGGSLDRAEEMFRKGLALAPTFTGMRVGLGKTLVRKGRLAEARRELRAVLDERAPENPADWTLKDAKEAQALLDSIRGQS